MTRYYSKSTSGFYSDAIHAQMPADAIEISDAEHADLMTAQAQGKCIQADTDGKPVAVAQPAPTPQRQSLALSQAVQRHIDATAQSLGYDSILTAVSYANEPAVPEFQAQAVALRAASLALHGLGGDERRAQRGSHRRRGAGARRPSRKPAEVQRTGLIQLRD